MRDTLAVLAVTLAALRCLAAADPAPIPPDTVHLWMDTNGLARVALGRDLASREPPPPPADVQFRAFAGHARAPGLVPIFLVESRDPVLLRRHALRGQENTTEPAFLALPLPDEASLTNIVGPWDCLAIRPGISKAWFGWEFAADLDRLSGRFEQTTDYRFAHIAAGNFQSNRLDLRIEYVNDRYELSGELHDGLLRGTWRRLDDPESGTWEATRPTVKPLALPLEPAVPLLEWRRESDDARRYSLDAGSPGPGWVRTARPLGLIWPAEAAREPTRSP